MPKSVLALIGCLLLAGMYCVDSNTEALKQERGPMIDAGMVLKIQNAKVLFAHQSVGQNILDGLPSVLGSEQIPQISIVTLAEVTAAESSYFAHAYVGKNYDPASKIEGFLAIVSELVARGAAPDVAAMKLCFVDISPKTDVEAIFRKYQAVIDSVRTIAPQTKIVHITTPVITYTSIKDKLKVLLQGDGNIMRNRYNELMRAAYGELVFDLAAREADGIITHRSGERVYDLNAAYSDDGGHLNSKGQEHISSHFIAFLSSKI